MTILDLRKTCTNVSNFVKIEIYAYCGMQKVKLCETTFANIPTIFTNAHMREFTFEKDCCVLKIVY